LPLEPPKIDWVKAAPLFALGLWGLITILWSPLYVDAFGETFQWAIGLGVFLLGASTVNPKWLYCGFALGLIPCYVFNLMQPNPDILAEAAALGIVATMSVGILLIAPWLIPVIILWWTPQTGWGLITHGRTALMGLAVTAVVAAWQYSRKMAVIGAIGAMALLTTLLVFGNHTTTTHERFDIWQDAIAGIGWFGHGIGSFWTDYPRSATHMDILAGQRPEHAHDDLLEIAFELGILGAVLAVGAISWLLARSRKEPEALILVTMLAMGVTGFPLHMPASFFMAVFAVGRLCRRGDFQHMARAGRTGDDQVNVPANVLRAA
jgi:O-antigen ligase